MLVTCRECWTNVTTTLSLPCRSCSNKTFFTVLFNLFIGGYQTRWRIIIILVQNWATVCDAERNVLICDNVSVAVHSSLINKGCRAVYNLFGAGADFKLLCGYTQVRGPLGRVWVGFRGPCSYLVCMSDLSDYHSGLQVDFCLNW